MKDEFCACPGLGCSPATMMAGWFHSYGSPPVLSQIPDRQVLLTHQGRTAVGLLCNILGLGQGDEVLLPAYNCGAEVDPFICAGCKVVFYRIDRAARADVGDIKSRLSSATRVIYVTHFFGWPQDMGEIGDVCKQRHLFLVEDCAQALLSGGGERFIGKLGDAVICSYGKFLGLPDGGALTLKQPTTSIPVFFPSITWTWQASLPLFKKWFMQHNSLWQRYPWGRRLLNRSWKSGPGHRQFGGRLEMLPSNCFDANRRFWKMSRTSVGILKKTNMHEVVTRRRRNFTWLSEHLKNNEHLIPLHESLPTDVCPLAYPVFAKDPGHARSYLEKNGIFVQGWPGYYPGMPWDEYPDACVLKDTLLTLPVHQDLSLEQMEYIAQCANSLGNHFSP